MPSDLSGRSDPGRSDPEAVLEFLSHHREAAERGTKTSRRTGRRGRTTALVAIVSAIAVAAAGVVVWRSVAGFGTAGTAHATALDTHGARAPTGASEKTGGAKTQKTALHRQAAEPWNRGLRPWKPAHPRSLPSFYYQWIRHTNSSCARYASYGCWKLKVVTRHGCPHGVMVFVEETRGGADAGASWGFSRKLAAKAATVVEVDADQGDVYPQIDSLLCKS